MNIIDQLKTLFENHLYEDVRQLAGLVLTISDHNPDAFSVLVKQQVLVYQADAYFQNGQYKKAESIYRKALQLKKVTTKVKVKSAGTSQELAVEADIKYKLHLCYHKQKMLRDAVAMLESINTKQRNAKVNMALGRLYHKTGNDRSAVTAYKEVLRECPLSLEAAQGLLMLGVKGAEVASLMLGGSPNIAGIDWVSLWIKGHANVAARDYTTAISAFMNLDAKTLLKDNTDVLCTLGRVQFLNGDYNTSKATLNRAHTMDGLLLHDMDILAHLLYRQKEITELQTLSTQLMMVSEIAPEPWVSMGYYCLATKKAPRAVYFAHRAYNLNSHQLEALMLKGTALLELRKTKEATVHFREALRISPHRYEAYKGLVECYLAERRNREATNCAAQAYKQLGTNARSLTLYASVLAKEAMSLEKAKTYLGKALKIDSHHLEAVYLMAEILGQQQQYDKGIELLRLVINEHATCRLHQMLGDFLSQKNEHGEALEHYSIALSMDPANTRAREGLERVEKQAELGSSYDVDVDELQSSDNEAELEGSDLESNWSDIELN